MEEIDWIPRDHPQYIDIENFEDHEFTVCVAYEMAIRAPGVREIINNNLYDNTYWYSINILCTINLLLDTYNMENINKVSQIQVVYEKSRNKEFKRSLQNFILQHKYNWIYHTVLIQEKREDRNYEHLKETKRFYKLVSRYQKMIDNTHYTTTSLSDKVSVRKKKGHVSFMGVFKILDNLGNLNYSNQPLSRKAIELLYNKSNPSVQEILKKMVILNSDLSQDYPKYTSLYKLDKEDAKILYNDYSIDAYHGDEIASLRNLYIQYNFIGIYDERIDGNQENFTTEKKFDIPMFPWSRDEIRRKDSSIERQRPLLHTIPIVDNFILTLPPKEHEAQLAHLEALRKHKKFIVSFYNLFAVDDTVTIKEQDYLPSNEKLKMTDMFFLYDNKEFFDEYIKSTKNNLKKELKDKHKRLREAGLLLKDSTYGNQETLGEYFERLKERNRASIEENRIEFEVQVELKLEEYYKLTDIGSVGMKRASLFAKYKKMKKIIAKGEYKKL